MSNRVRAGQVAPRDDSHYFSMVEMWLTFVTHICPLTLIIPIALSSLTLKYKIFHCYVHSLSLFLLSLNKLPSRKIGTRV